MYIRLGQKTVRYRISCEELKRLLNGDKLKEMIVMAGKQVALTINAVPKDGKLDFIYEEGRLGLIAPIKLLRELAESGRQKEGVSNESGGSLVSLEVDLKTYPRTSQVA